MPQVMSRDDVRRAIARIAHEIVEGNRASTNLIVVGIEPRGSLLAERLATEINTFSGLEVPLVTIRPAEDGSFAEAPLPSVVGRCIILVDDVLFAGWTIEQALRSLSQNGRPSSVRLAVLVDRGHRQLPIRPDYVGKNLPTANSQTVLVQFDRLDDDEGVWIEDSA